MGGAPIKFSLTKYILLTCTILVCEPAILSHATIGKCSIILIDSHDVRLLEFCQDNPFGLNLRTRTMTTERARKMGGGGGGGGGR